MSKLPGDTTLTEAKQHLREEWKKGTNCPCCGQRVQLYDYKLYSTSASALVRLFKLGQGYHHVSKYAEAGNGYPRAPHFAELRFWDLIADMPKSDNDTKKKSSGFWRITSKGIQFVLKEIEVPSRILVYNNKFQGYSEKSTSINIKQAFDNEFDYEELMGGGR